MVGVGRGYPLVTAVVAIPVTHLMSAVLPTRLSGPVSTAMLQLTVLLVSQAALLNLATALLVMMTCPMWPLATVTLNMSMRSLLDGTVRQMASPLVALAMPVALKCSPRSVLPALTTPNRYALLQLSTLDSIPTLFTLPTLAALALAVPAMLLLDRQLM